MAFDLDDEELEATRVNINHLPPKKTQEKDKKLFNENEQDVINEDDK